MPKRLNLRNRRCPKCGGKIGVVRRATKGDPLALLGCVEGRHMLVDGTYGYSADDFPKRVKPPSKKEIDRFIRTVRYPRLAAFVVNKLIKKFGFTREQAEAAWRSRIRLCSKCHVRPEWLDGFCSKCRGKAQGEK